MPYEGQDNPSSSVHHEEIGLLDPSAALLLYRRAVAHRNEASVVFLRGLSTKKWTMDYKGADEDVLTELGNMLEVDPHDSDCVIDALARIAVEPGDLVPLSRVDLSDLRPEILADSGRPDSDAS